MATENKLVHFYIDDCLDGVKINECEEFIGPVNIGSKKWWQ